MTDLFKPLRNFKEKEIKKSPGILDDYSIRKNIATREGTIEKVPVNNSDIANKAYVDTSSRFTLFFQHVNFSPADSTTYYFGVHVSMVGLPANSLFANMGFAFKVIGATISCSNNAVSGSTEDVTLQLRNDTTSTSSTIGTFKTNGTTTTIATSSFTGLDIDVGASDSICLQMDTPAYATNPTGFQTKVWVHCQKT